MKKSKSESSTEGGSKSGKDGSKKVSKKEDKKLSSKKKEKETSEAPTQKTPDASTEPAQKKTISKITVTEFMFALIHLTDAAHKGLLEKPTVQT